MHKKHAALNFFPKKALKLFLRKKETFSILKREKNSTFTFRFPL